MNAAGSEVDWSEITALFGGTFDPPHLGHREAIKGLFTIPGVQRVWVIPSPAPPHKPSIASPEQRIAMARLCFMDGPEPFVKNVELNFVELERSVRSPEQPTYSFDTIAELKRQNPKLAFVIGTDQLEKLNTWSRFPALLGLCHWLVLARKPQGEAKAMNTLKVWESSGLCRHEPTSPHGLHGVWRLREGTILKLVPTEAPEISSTLIRETIGRTGSPPENTLSQSISAYLKANRLYGTRPT